MYVAFSFGFPQTVPAASMNNTVSGLRFFFRVTLGRADIASHLPFVRQPHKLPVVLSPEEVSRFLEAAPGLKYKAAFSVAYGAGLRASEVMSLKPADIDSKRMVIRVEQGKGHPPIGKRSDPGQPDQRRPDQLRASLIGQ